MSAMMRQEQAALILVRHAACPHITARSYKAPVAGQARCSAVWVGLIRVAVSAWAEATATRQRLRPRCQLQ